MEILYFLLAIVPITLLHVAYLIVLANLQMQILNRKFKQLINYALLSINHLYCLHFLFYAKIFDLCLN